MMAVIVTVWSIGFVAYNFIWNYYYSWSGRVRSPVGPRRLVRWRYWQNLGVFVAYVAAGISAYVSILCSGFALLRDSPASLSAAWTAFAISLGVHFVLFSFEIETSVVNVWRRLR